MRRSPRLAVGLAVVVGVDLLTKLVAATFAAGHTSGLIVPVHNPEFSLGIAGASPAMTILIAGIGLALAAGYTIPAALAGRLAPWVPACLLGGSIANLIDRTAFGAVHDFLATPWAIINLADLAVVAGLVGLLVARHRNRGHLRADPMLVHDV
jgi:lipoprotein signal peptidase